MTAAGSIQERFFLSIGVLLCLIGNSVWAFNPIDEFDFVSKHQGLQDKRLPIGDTQWSIRFWSEMAKDGSELTCFEVFQGDLRVTEKRSAGFEVKLRNDEFDPLYTVPPVNRKFEAGDGCQTYIVQFATPILDVYRQEIHRLGGEPGWFVPNHALIVTIDPKALETVVQLPYVRWVGRYHPAYRMERFLLDNYERAGGLFPIQTYNIMVHRAGLGQKSAVAEKIGLLGGTVDNVDAGKYLLRATLTPEQLFQVVFLDEVLFIDRWGPFETDMNKAREFGGANYIEVTPPLPGYTGHGVRGESFDSGCNINHVDFQNPPLMVHTGPGGNFHGTACAGICFGDGTGNSDARGLLPDAQGIVALYTGILGTPNRYTHTGELVEAPYHAVFQTSSVGSPRTSFYTTISADMDAALFDFDIVHCQSQGDSGNPDSRPEAWSKNIISAGGVYHYDTLDPSDDCWCAGASNGPAQDGRIKPDLCAYYDEILTVGYPGNNDYTTTFGGASGATPIVCGHVGLVFQMWHEGIFGNPTPGATVFENRCHMTTAKALLINTARQYPFSGTGHDLTRVNQGWGWPDVKNLYGLRNKLFFVDETDLLEPFGMNDYAIDVGPGEPALKATLVYADPAGNPAASMQRINDLTLKVTSPSGVVYWGNHGLLEGNWSSPGGAPNVVDTVENVFIEAPESGVWSVEVYGDEIVEDGHVETPAVDADYALIVTGGVEVPGFTMSIDPMTRVVCAGDDAVYNLDFQATLGFAESVDLEVTGHPPGSTPVFGQDPITPPGSTTLTIGTAPMCLGDLNGDGVVDADDVDEAVTAWRGVRPSGDTNGNGLVDAADMVWIMENPGPCSTAAEDGEYILTVTGTAASMSQMGQPTLHLASDVPDTPALIAPGNGAVNVSRQPSFTWNAASEAVDYYVQVAEDAGFSTIVYQATVSDTTFDLPVMLASLTEYFWHVKGMNGCGDGAYSGVFSFTTAE